MQINYLAYHSDVKEQEAGLYTLKIYIYLTVGTLIMNSVEDISTVLL